MPPEFATPFMKKVVETRSGQLVRHEYTLPLPDGLHHFEARLARVPGSDQLIAIVRDVSEQTALQQERERLNHFNVLLFRLARNFINLSYAQADAGIDEALGEMGTYVGVDRAYVFRYDFDANTATNTHEWCAEGITSVKSQVQDTHMDDQVRELVRLHEQGQIIAAENVRSMPPGWLRDLLEGQGVRSFISLPLISHDRCLGFVGFD